MNNIGSYFEIPVSDLDRAIRFYSEVFECEFFKETIHQNEMAFFPFDSKKEGITGALAKGETYKPSLNGTLIYLGVSNIEKVLERVLKQNGEILFPITPVADIGFVAEFKDSEGNRVALFQKKDK